MITRGQIGINFGITSTVETITGLFQLRDHKPQFESRLLKDVNNKTTAKLYFDPKEVLIFTYIAAAPFQTAAAPVTMPNIGTQVLIVDPIYPYINGTWLIDEIESHASNTTATRVVVKLSRFQSFPQ
jgi:hypothetical protein